MRFKNVMLKIMHANCNEEESQTSENLCNITQKMASGFSWMVMVVYYLNDAAEKICRDGKHSEASPIIMQLLLSVVPLLISSTGSNSQILFHEAL